jgi:hypothetical protein
VVEPIRTGVGRYEDAYRVFRQAQDTLTPIAHALSARQRPGRD